MFFRNLVNGKELTQIIYVLMTFYCIYFDLNYRDIQILKFVYLFNFIVLNKLFFIEFCIILLLLTWNIYVNIMNIN